MTERIDCKQHGIKYGYCEECAFPNPDGPAEGIATKEDVCANTAERNGTCAQTATDSPHVETASVTSTTETTPAKMNTTVFNESLHAAALACGCNKLGKFPCSICKDAWHQAWDIAEGKISRPVEPAAPVVQIGDKEQAEMERTFGVTDPITSSGTAEETDMQKQMNHDAGLISTLMDDVKRLRKDRDDWCRKYFEMERAQSRSIDQNGEHIKRIQRLERDKDELRSEIKSLSSQPTPVVVRPDMPKAVPFRTRPDGGENLYYRKHEIDAYILSLTAQPAPLPDGQYGPPAAGFTHDLKVWPEFYQPIAEGRKTFELRKNDRDYKVGDRLHLREFDPHAAAYTGRKVMVEVKYILHGGAFGMPEDVCIMSIASSAALPVGQKETK